MPQVKFTPRLIGIGGLKRSGKDTVANHWADTQGYQVMGMSDPLLEMAQVLDPIIPIQASPETMRLSKMVDLMGYVAAKENPEVRAFLQRLGTDVGRKMIDEDLWTKQAEKTIRVHWMAGQGVIVTGIRFPNEVAMIKRLGGALVWVDRPGLTTDGHASETSVSAEDFEFSILNDRTLENLYTSVDGLFRSMVTPHRAPLGPDVPLRDLPDNVLRSQIQRMRDEGLPTEGIAIQVIALHGQAKMMDERPDTRWITLDDNTTYGQQPGDDQDLMRAIALESRRLMPWRSKAAEVQRRKEHLDKVGFSLTPQSLPEVERLLSRIGDIMQRKEDQDERDRAEAARHPRRRDSV